MKKYKDLYLGREVYYVENNEIVTTQLSSIRLYRDTIVLKIVNKTEDYNNWKESYYDKDLNYIFFDYSDAKVELKKQKEKEKQKIQFEIDNLYKKMNNL